MHVVRRIRKRKYNIKIFFLIEKSQATRESRSNVLRLLPRVSNIKRHRIEDIASLLKSRLQNTKLGLCKKRRIVCTRYRNLSDVNLGSRLCECAFLGVCHRFKFNTEQKKIFSATRPVTYSDAIRLRLLFADLTICVNQYTRLVTHSLRSFFQIIILYLWRRQ